MRTVEAGFAVVESISIGTILGFRCIANKIAIFTPTATNQIFTINIIFGMRTIHRHFFMKCYDLLKKWA